MKYLLKQTKNHPFCRVFFTLLSIVLIAQMSLWIHHKDSHQFFLVDFLIITRMKWTKRRWS